ncbi:MAG: hypothetical protein V8Q88_01745 [Christensenellales bacterium]
MKKKRNGKTNLQESKSKCAKQTENLAELRPKYGCKMNEMDV